MIRLKSIEEVSLTQNNYVLVKITGIGKPLKLPGTDIIIDTTFNPEYHVDTIGTVEKVPEQLVLYSRKQHQLLNAMMWDTEMEVKPGDLVYMDYLAVLDALGTFFNPMGNYDNSKFVITRNNDIYVFIHYSRLYAKKGENGLYPLNGYVILEGGNKDFHKVPGQEHRPKAPHFKVLYTGRPNKWYVYGKGIDAYISPGQNVYCKTKNIVSMRYDLYQDKRVYMLAVQGRDIIAIRDEKGELCAMREGSARNVGTNSIL